MERQSRCRSAHLALAYSRFRPLSAHIHELVFDFLHRLQGKFLRFFRTWGGTRCALVRRTSVAATEGGLFLTAENQQINHPQIAQIHTDF